ncbi:phosphotransferase family protein [Saccharothrix xinjiangensis]|uniref:Phosphotransferase family protein n=1 Tax=Saccharothrix xinjiangensis TaxID=204798 RepID=A0ABV9XZ52_9PSEU
MEFAGGWDSVAVLVGRWVERRPRRPDVEAQLRREVRLMPWLAPRLPLAVPVPELVSDDPLVVRHPLVPGEPTAGADPAHGRALGGFLRALHATPTAGAADLGVARADHDGALDRFGAEVVPLLPASRRGAALALLDAARGLPADTVVHGDIGPEHVLADGTGLTGVIDFGDTHLGDPAIDLAWALHGAARPFADAVAESFGVTGEQRERALVWHRLGPWHEVTHAFDTGASPAGGVEGVLDRLSP